MTGDLLMVNGQPVEVLEERAIAGHYEVGKKPVAYVAVIVRPILEDARDGSE